MKHFKSKYGYIVVILAILFLFFKNYNKTDFWHANFIQILTLCITVFLSYFFVQRLNDKRRKIDYYQQILNEIQHSINNDSMLFSCNKEAILLQKSISNKIKHLRDHSFIQTEEALKYINSEFTELRELYDNHSQTEARLKDIEPDIIRHKVNISNKIDKVKLILFDT